MAIARLLGEPKKPNPSPLRLMGHDIDCKSIARCCANSPGETVKKTEDKYEKNRCCNYIAKVCSYK